MSVIADYVQAVLRGGMKEPSLPAHLGANATAAAVAEAAPAASVVAKAAAAPSLLLPFFALVVVGAMALFYLYTQIQALRAQARAAAEAGKGALSRDDLIELLRMERLATDSRIEESSEETLKVLNFVRKTVATLREEIEAPIRAPEGAAAAAAPQRE